MSEHSKTYQEPISNNPLAGDISGEQVTPEDRDLFERELADFLPGRIFDAHAHAYRLSDCHPQHKAGELPEPGNYSIKMALKSLELFMGGHTPCAGLFFPFPKAGVNREGANRYIIEELKQNPDSRGLLLATPQDSQESMASLLEAPGIRGFKTYHVFAGENSFHQPVGKWTPEWVWELAHERQWLIMLHLVRAGALSDAGNQRYLREHCLRYPMARVVLAHAGRGFNYRHTRRGLASLRGLANIRFDTSAIAEPEALMAILEESGPGCLLFGSDFPVSNMRTRSITVGDGFYWLHERECLPDWELGKPVPNGLESLLALKAACEAASLNERDVERIFYDNAAEWLDLPRMQNWDRVQEQYQTARQIIPGGTQLFSKRPELFAPDQWPAYYEEARGCEIIDTQGRCYVDMSTGGILSCILGYADPDVNRAVLRRVKMGNMSTLQTYDEVELAGELIAIHPWSGQARFTRGGGESMAVAVRIARAHTGRSKVAVCGYHGWHDWYLAANLGSSRGEGSLDSHLMPGLEPNGVPRELEGTTLPFTYNHLEELESIVAMHGADLAAIVMEPTRSVAPEPGFLEGVRRLAGKAGACLIFDEISIGWRLCLGGAHLHYGVEPDLAVFAKALSNGYAFGAVLGRSDIMEACQRSFISSAYWTEGIGPAAALATVRKLRLLDVPAHLAAMGTLVEKGWKNLGEKHGLPVKTGGPPQLLQLGFEHPQQNAMITYLTARMLGRGFLCGASFNAMWSHQPSHVSRFLEALDPVFASLTEALSSGKLKASIGGPEKQVGFARLVR